MNVNGFLMSSPHGSLIMFFFAQRRPAYANQFYIHETKICKPSSAANKWLHNGGGFTKTLLKPLYLCSHVTTYGANHV